MSAKKMRDLWFDGFPLLRYEPTEMRIRVVLGGQEIVDTTRAVLVWEPRRVVPSYAVPVAELRADLTASATEALPPPDGILHPGIPFAAHSTPGQVVDVGGAVGVGFRPDDAELAEYVVLDFRGFDEWFEEDERLVAHAREPYHRVDVRPSSRHVRVELDGVLIAESSRPTLVFETSLPTRFYLPREDIVAELHASDLQTSCAYKGRAIYYSVSGRDDFLWSYPDPLPEARGLTDLIAFYDDVADVYVDGKLRARPDDVIAEALRQEVGLSS
jgi:uncharacterized protein (DUF427 family)